MRQDLKGDIRARATEQMKLASPIVGILLTEPDVVAALIQAQNARIRRAQAKIEEAEAMIEALRAAQAPLNASQPEPSLPPPEPPSNPGPLMVPLKEAVQRLPMARRTVDRAIAEGRIKVKHFGRRVYVPISEIARIERDGLPR
jgi:hypothetical protein